MARTPSIVSSSVAARPRYYYYYYHIFIIVVVVIFMGVAAITTLLTITIIYYCPRGDHLYSMAENATIVYRRFTPQFERGGERSTVIARRIIILYSSWRVWCECVDCRRIIIMLRISRIPYYIIVGIIRTRCWFIGNCFREYYCYYYCITWNRCIDLCIITIIII